MKKTFLKTVMAATVVVATMAVSSVSTWAAALPTDPTNNLEMDTSYDVTTANKKMTGNKNLGTEVSSTDGLFTYTCKVDSGGINLVNDGNGAKFKTPKNEDCKAVFTESNTKSDGQAAWLEGSETKTATIVKGGTTTIKLPADTVVTLTGTTNTNTKITNIEIKTAKEPTAYYSISGIVTVDGTAKAEIPVKMTGSDYVTQETVKTLDDGRYTFEHVGDIESVDISIDDTSEYFGDTITNIKPEKNLTNIDFNLKKKEKAMTVDAEDTVNLVEGLTAAETKEVVPDDTVIGKYFTVSGNAGSGKSLIKILSSGKVSALETGKDGNGNLKFTTTKDFKVTIECSSNNNDKSSNITVDANKTAVTGLDNHTKFVIDKLPAGTYTITSNGSSSDQNSNGETKDTSGRGVRLYSVKFEDIAAEDNADGATDGAVAVIKGADGTYYAVVIVSEAEAQANSALKVNAGGNSASIETVYSKVAIGDNEYTAEDLGGSAGDYVSGIKLDINNSSSATVNAETIQDKITVDKVAVAA